MKFTIKVEANGRICNPLLKLAGREFEKREEACEEIYNALYETIDSEDGCEMIPRPATPDLSDKEYGVVLDRYIDDCYAYIMREGYATEDGVSAYVEEA